MRSPAGSPMPRPARAGPRHRTCRLRRSAAPALLAAGTAQGDTTFGHEVRDRRPVKPARQLDRSRFPDRRTGCKSAASGSKPAFIGAGGGALPPPQQAGTGSEVMAFGGFPVSGQCRTNRPELTGRHHAKVLRTGAHRRAADAGAAPYTRVTTGLAAVRPVRRVGPRNSSRPARSPTCRCRSLPDNLLFMIGVGLTELSLLK